jgi:hypothetical protein
MHGRPKSSCAGSHGREASESIGGPAMLDQEEKELYLDWTAMLIFAMALVYFQQ